jgi:UDP-3-O-[3-hydroxymyristoyl] glucosamine N-acyltransferase
MKKSIKEIAALLNGEAVGDEKLSIKGAANIGDAENGDITFAFDDKAAQRSDASKASCVIVPANLKNFPQKPHIKVRDIKMAMAKILDAFEVKPVFTPGIHKSSIISKSAKIGKNVTVMANVNVGDNSSIGDNSVIYPGVFIGNDCKIGRDTVIRPNVVLYDRTDVGNKCILHAGTVLGVDGYGFAPIDGKYAKIAQIGNVIVEDDVEIFANVCVSCATMGSTVIGKGTKIDNICHIAHNCKIGENCALTGLVAIAGSTELKDHVSIGGTTGVNDHITIGENTVVMGRSGVTKDIPANSVISGFPAQDHKRELEMQAAIRRLPKLIEKISELEKNLSPTPSPTGRRGERSDAS